MAVQTSLAPTNKLMAGGISAAVITSAWSEVFATWPAVSGPGVSTLMGILLAFAIGYFIPDRPNVATLEDL